MFADFNKVFQKNTQKELSVPDSLLNYLSKSLPEGLSYHADHEGNCFVIPTDGQKMHISNLVPCFTAEQKKAIGEKYTSDDLLRYMYNSQESIEFKPQHSGKMTINGNNIEVSQFIQNPFHKDHVVDGSFFPQPPSFPEPFNVTIGAGNYNRILTIRQVVNQSIDTEKYESNPDEALILVYYLNTVQHTMRFSVSLNMKATKNVKDYVECMSIFNAFVDGRITFNEHPIPTRPEVSNQKKFDAMALIFWEKVLKIEEHLGVSFVPTQNEIDHETMCIVEQLYQSFFFQTPTKDLKRVDSVSGLLVANPKLLDDCVGKSLFFTFECDTKIELLGLTIDLYCIAGQCNAVVSNVETDEKSYKMTFKDISDDKPFFTSVIYFKTKEQRQQYRKEGDSVVNAMLNAQRPSFYLNNVSSTS